MLRHTAAPVAVMLRHHGRQPLPPPSSALEARLRDALDAAVASAEANKARPAAGNPSCPVAPGGFLRPSPALQAAAIPFHHDASHHGIPVVDATTGRLLVVQPRGQVACPLRSQVDATTGIVNVRVSDRMHHHHDDVNRCPSAPEGALPAIPSRCVELHCSTHHGSHEEIPEESVASCQFPQVGAGGDLDGSEASSSECNSQGGEGESSGSFVEFRRQGLQEALQLSPAGVHPLSEELRIREQQGLLLLQHQQQAWMMHRQAEEGERKEGHEQVTGYSPSRLFPPPVSPPVGTPPRPLRLSLEVLGRMGMAARPLGMGGVRTLTLALADAVLASNTVSARDFRCRNLRLLNYEDENNSF